MILGTAHYYIWRSLTQLEVAAALWVIIFPESKCPMSYPNLYWTCHTHHEWPSREIPWLCNLRPFPDTPQPAVSHTSIIQVTSHIQQLPPPSSHCKPKVLSQHYLHCVLSPPTDRQERESQIPTCMYQTRHKMVDG